MNNPVEIFRELLVGLGLTAVSDTSSVVLGLIMIVVLVVLLRLVMGIIQNITKMIVTIATLGVIAWILFGMFA